MKKTLCMVFVFASLFLVSCNNHPISPESISAVATNVATADINTVVSTTFNETSNMINQIETQDTLSIQTQASTTTTTDEFEFHIVGNYQSTREIPFEKLHRFAKNHRVNAKKWYTNISVVDDIKTSFGYKERVPFIVTVVGYSGEKSPVAGAYNRSEYYIYRHSYGDYISDGEIHRMMTLGYPEEPVYGTYRIEIGEKYLSLKSKYDANLQTQGDSYGILSFLMKIVEVDGVEWVYPTLYHDFSNMKCAVRITDEYEQLFYKPGVDDDIIAYLEKNDIPKPKIEYKCELYAFLDEVMSMKEVDIDNFTPVGEYTSIIDSFPFEGFAEYPENMLKNKDDPYTLKELIDITKYDPDIPGDRDTVVMIIGYRNSEIGNDGMIYSYYYVYACPRFYRTPAFYDDTVYIMQAYGSPSHPYYGQRRIEIGDMYLRLETDTSFYQTDEIIPATQLFYLGFVENDRYGPTPRVYPDFGTDFSNLRNLWYGIDDFEKYVYREGRDDDIIAYMNENGIEPPVYKEKEYLVFFSKNHRLGRIEEHN